MDLSDKNPGLLDFMFRDDFTTEFEDSETMKNVMDVKALRLKNTNYHYMIEKVSLKML